MIGRNIQARLEPDSSRPSSGTLFERGLDRPTEAGHSSGAHYTDQDFGSCGLSSLF